MKIKSNFIEKPAVTIAGLLGIEDNFELRNFYHWLLISKSFPHELSVRIPRRQYGEVEIH